jgi:UMF1 family MFS transporter
MIAKGDKKIIRAWTFYDWANSVYPLVISTAIFPIFYESNTGEFDAEGKRITDLVNFFGFELKNTVLYYLRDCCFTFDGFNFISNSFWSGRFFWK